MAIHFCSLTYSKRGTYLDQYRESLIIFLLSAINARLYVATGMVRMAEAFYRRKGRIFTFCDEINFNKL